MLNLTYKPKDYPLCLASEAECPKAAHCLRSLVVKQASASLTEQHLLTVINPFESELHYATEQCAAYHDATPLHCAMGMTKMFDNVPRAIYPEVHNAVQACFPCRTYFYKSRRGERPITPEEQQNIREVFISHNLGEPLFDGYCDLPQWNE